MDDKKNSIKATVNGADFYHLCWQCDAKAGLFDRERMEAFCCEKCHNDYVMNERASSKHTSDSETDIWVTPPPITFIPKPWWTSSHPLFK